MSTRLELFKVDRYVLAVAFLADNLLAEHLIVVSGRGWLSMGLVVGDRVQLLGVVYRSRRLK